MATERVSQETASQTPQGPEMCKNVCGFFGSQATMGLCSKCYRDLVKTGGEGAGAAVVVDERAERREEEVVVVVEEVAAALQPAVVQPAAVASPSRVERPVNRCGSCRKRVGLTGFQCRCGHVYCAMHRYSDKHNCTFDYKAAGQEAIAKANPLVVAEKVVKF